MHSWGLWPRSCIAASNPTLLEKGNCVHHPKLCLLAVGLRWPEILHTFKWFCDWKKVVKSCWCTHTHLRSRSRWDSHNFLGPSKNWRRVWFLLLRIVHEVHELDIRCGLGILSDRSSCIPFLVLPLWIFVWSGVFLIFCVPQACILFLDSGSVFRDPSCWSCCNWFVFILS